MRRLLVIVPDQISQILVKGEYQPGYYNPGDFFDEVHLLMTNEDRPELVALQRTVGKAKLVVHNYPEQPALIVDRQWRRWWCRDLKRWADTGVALAKEIKPHLIRCHGADWNSYLASRIKKKLGIPYVVSLHINPDVNPPRRIIKENLSQAEKNHNEFFEYLEGTGLRNADLVMPVYQPIIPYLERLKIKRVKVCYNVLNRLHLKKKTDYKLNEAPHLVCVGRLIPEKNPSNILKAVARFEKVKITIVGDGPLLSELQQLANELGLNDRAIFRPAVPNDELCGMMPTFDLFVVHTEYWELNKSVLEALLTGLPVVINRRIGKSVPELENADVVHFVDNSSNAYFEAFELLFTNDEVRKDLGTRAWTYADAHWSPRKTEQIYVDIYKELIDK